MIFSVNSLRRNLTPTPLFSFYFCSICLYAHRFWWSGPRNIIDFWFCKHDDAVDHHDHHDDDQILMAAFVETMSVG